MAYQAGGITRTIKAEYVAKLMKSVIAISRRTFPLASEKLRPIDSKTGLPSTSITWGTYATFPAIKKNNQRASMVAAIPPITPTKTASQMGTHWARKTAPRVAKITIMYQPKNATVKARASHSIMMSVAPNKDQNLERTAAYVVRTSTGSFQRRCVTRLREAPPMTNTGGAAIRIKVKRWRRYSRTARSIRSPAPRGTR